MTVLAFDVGGTHLRSALVEADGRLHQARDVASPAGGASAFVATLIEEAEHQRRQVPGPLAAVGLAMAGYTDRRSGRVHGSATLGLNDVLVGPPLQQALALPVRLVNDVNAAAVAEADAAGCRDLVALLIGTGVGTGFVCNGTLVEGLRGFAAEGGHATWRSGGRPCACGLSGCYQASLGGAALAERAAAAGLPGDTAALVQSWRDGDPTATAIMDEALAALTDLCRLLVTLLDPERIVVAGGVANATPELLAAARAAVDPHPLAFAAGPVLVEPARLGPDAGLLGAAILARRELDAG